MSAREPSADEAPEQYCRAVEAYLCRKNDGHLVRIVGPAFEQVCGWAARGVPLRIACIGIDRYFERYYAKGPRRRPVRIEFCEADVLDAFDEWRRAVGVPAAEPRDPDDEDSSRRHGPLSSHLERVVARLTALRSGADPALSDLYDAIVRELDAARGAGKSVRGQAREAVLARLRELDAMLLDAARNRCDEGSLREIERSADEELAPFRQRMPRDAYVQAQQACVDRLVRERLRLPVLTFE